MQNHSELFIFATRFWWLIFPIGWGLAGVLRASLRHGQALQALELLQTYAAQNKEPPPELLALLKPRERNVRLPRNRTLPLLMGGFFCAATAVAFLVMTVARGNGDHDNHVGLLFTTVLMAGCAVAMLLGARIVSRDQKNLPPS